MQCWKLLTRKRKMFKGNKIYIVDKNGKRRRIFGFIKGLNIRFKGKNSVVEIHEPIARFSKCKIRVSNNSFVSIGGSTDIIKKLHINGASNQNFIIGKDFFTWGCDIATANEKGLSIKIGDNCMFSRDILIRASDGHSVIDKDTKEVLNFGKNITIGNDVWIAGNVAILKGVNIGDGSIIGHGSIVTKDCESFCAYAGNPAKLIKRNVTWKRESPENYISS